MKSVFRSAVVVSLSILSSRLFGLIRDVVIASQFGAGALTDTFFVAFRIPNLLRRVFAEGAFNSAFVPAFVKKLKVSREEAKEFAGSFFTVLTSLLVVTVLLGEVAAPLIVKVVAPGFGGSSFSLAVKLLRELLPYILLVSLVAFFGGILNSLNHFFAPAFSTTLFNLALITSALLLADELSVEALSIGVLAGGVFQLALQLYFLLKLKFSFKPLLRVTPEVLRVLKNTVPGVFGFAVRQLSMLIDTVIASFLSAGAISYLYYANRFVQLPLGMFAIGLSQVLLPRFSDRGEKSLFSELLAGVTLCSAIIVPSGVGLLFFGRAIVDLIFNHGKFTPQDLEGTYLVLVGYAAGLFFFALEKIVTNAFYSVEEFSLPVKVAASTLVVNLLLNLILCFYLGLGALGLALGTSLTSLLNLILLSHFLSRRLGNGLLKRVFFLGGKYLFLSLPVAAVAFLGNTIYFNLSSFLLRALTILGVVFLACLVYFLTLYLLKDEVVVKLTYKED